MAQTWEGFWQVVYDDAEEEIVGYPALFRLVRVEGECFEAGFASDGSDATEWRRRRR